MSNYTASNHGAAQGALRAEFWSLPPDAYASREMVAAAYFLLPASLEAYAIRGGGPKYMRINRRALYCKRDVLDWAKATGRTVESTAQLDQAEK